MSLRTRSPLSFTRALGISIPLCSPCNMIYAPSEREKSARGTRSEKFVFPRSYTHPSISEGEKGGKRGTYVEYCAAATATTDEWDSVPFEEGRGCFLPGVL
jgi:hypothetical protein